MEDLIRHYLISGRVQGVGYRAFARRAAGELKLAGWVRNLQDGRVESVARGPRASLEAFEKRLREGPGRSLVESMSVSVWSGSAVTVTEFEVRKDGHEPCSEF